MRKSALSLIASLALTAAALPASAQGYGSAQYYPSNPAPAAPASWSYSPYTSGLSACLNRAPGDDRCSETTAPTAGQPNYWARCAAGSSMPFGGMAAQADAQCHQIAVTRAYEYAYAQQAAIAQQVDQQAARGAGMLTLPASAYEPVSVDYTT